MLSPRQRKATGFRVHNTSGASHVGCPHRVALQSPHTPAGSPLMPLRRRLPRGRPDPTVQGWVPQAALASDTDGGARGPHGPLLGLTIRWKDSQDTGNGRLTSTVRYKGCNSETAHGRVHRVGVGTHAGAPGPPRTSSETPPGSCHCADVRAQPSAMGEHPAPGSGPTPRLAGAPATAPHLVPQRHSSPPESLRVLAACVTAHEAPIVPPLSTQQGF